MARPSKQQPDTPASSGASNDLPFAQTLWEAADNLRGSVEASEYKHLVLGLLFLKYISDAFARRQAELEAQTREAGNELYTEDEKIRAEVLEDRDEYTAEQVFWVPEKARFEALLAAASKPNIGTRIDSALEALERDNEELRGVLPRIYARSGIDAARLGQLVTTLAGIGFGEDEKQARDILGRTYEYFIKMFARSEGQRGGEFYTPASVTRLLVEMLEPYEGRVFDPACGSCGLFIQSAGFVQAHGGRTQGISIYGQEFNQATWRIGRMNLAIHGLGGEVKLGDSLHDDKHPGLRADFVLANPPFNLDRWGADRVADDPRFKYGVPPDGNANYAWIQHFIHHLAPTGRAGFVLANGSLTGRGQEGRIREAIVRDDLVDCIVALPAKLFYTTGIPVCLWFLDKDKSTKERRRRQLSERDRRGETLFIDAREMGVKISRTQIELSDAELARIADTYHAWRGEEGHEPYEDLPGFCKSVTLTEIEAESFALTPGRYVGAEVEVEEEGAFEARIQELTLLLADDLAVSDRLTAEVKKALKAMRHG